MQISFNISQIHGFYLNVIHRDLLKLDSTETQAAKEVQSAAFASTTAVATSAAASSAAVAGLNC